MGALFCLALAQATRAQIVCQSTWVSGLGQIEIVEFRVDKYPDSGAILVTINSLGQKLTAPLDHFRSVGVEEIFDLHPHVLEALDLLSLPPHQVKRASVHGSKHATLLSFFGPHGHPQRALIYGYQIFECR